MQSPTRIGLSDGFVPSNPRLKGVNAGSPLRQSTVNNLSRVAVRNTVKPSSRYRVRQREEGFTLDIKKQTQLNYGESPLTALFGKVGEFEGNNIYGVMVTTGVVNGEVPKIDGLYLDEKDEGGDYPYIQVESTGYICIKVYADEFKPFPSQDTEIVFVEDTIVDKNTDQYGYFPLARVFKNGDGDFSFATLSRGNIVANRVRVGKNTAVWYFNPYGF